MSWIITGTQRYQPAALLDQFPGAAAAYSLRNLVGTSNPAVVRVRRDNDDAEQDFTAAEVSDGTLAAWVGAGNDGFVRTWYDQSGNTRHMEQATSTSQPQIVVSGTLVTENGKPALATTSTTTMAITSALLLGQHSVFTAVSTAQDITSTMSTQRLWSSDASTFDVLSFGGNATSTLTNERLAWLTVDGPSVRGVGQTANDYTAGDYLISAFWNNSNPVVFVNNSSQLLNANSIGNFTSTSYPRTFQRLWGNSSATQGFAGKQFEFIFYSSDQSTNRAAIEANINAHYSIYP